MNGVLHAHHNEESELPPSYRVHLFGPFRVLRNTQPVGEPIWRRNKARALLKWFLLHPGRLFSADQLSALFWPNASRSAAARNLHVTINYLRHLLEPDLPPRQPSEYIRRNKNNFYWFERNAEWWADIFDIQHHYVCAKEAEQLGSYEQTITHYRAIVRYCSLGFLPEDAYDDVFLTHRRHYERIYIEALEGMIHLCSQAGRFDEVLNYANQALMVDPYCELAVRAIMNTFFHQGNIAGAIRKLNDFQQVLRNDLGLEPSEDMLALKQNMALPISVSAKSVRRSG